MSKWQSIETAPTDGTAVDLWVVDHIAGLEWREPEAVFRDGCWWTLSDEGEMESVGFAGIQEPSHWMPVPKPPKSDRPQA